MYLECGARNWEAEGQAAQTAWEAKASQAPRDKTTTEQTCQGLLVTEPSCSFAVHVEVEGGDDVVVLDVQVYAYDKFHGFIDFTRVLKRHFQCSVTPSNTQIYNHLAAFGFGESAPNDKCEITGYEPIVACTP
jgi:hypothetical protein